MDSSDLWTLLQAAGSQIRMGTWQMHMARSWDERFRTLVARGNILIRSADGHAIPDPFPLLTPSELAMTIYRASPVPTICRPIRNDRR